MDLILGVLGDSLVDTAKLIPFLFVTYLAMEALEHGAQGFSERVVRDAGHAGPILGALLGALPQCGFSAMASTLFSARVVTVGTLVAVILSTSDEMLPIFLASQVPAARLLSIIGSKVLIGMAVGLAADAVMRLLHRTGDGHAHIAELCERAHCHCEDEEDGTGEGHDGDVAGSVECASCGHSHHHAHAHGRWAIVRSALVHTAQVSLFIFTVSIVMGLAIELVGEAEFAAFVGTHPVRAVFLAALVGLIPNCGASVVISELYLTGGLPAGAMMAGLLVSGGVGLLVLYRTNSDVRQNVAITVFLYGVSVACGLVVAMLGIGF